MSKIKLFAENMLVYGLGGIISKLIPLLMLPIVTRIMPGTDYFGLSDMSNTIVQFGSAIAIMGMYDAMYRMFFDKDDEQYKKMICSTTVFFTIAMSIAVTLLAVIFKDIIAKYIFGDIKYSYLVYISAMTILVSATNSIISAPTRMRNQRKVFLVTNSLTPILSYSISIPLILTGHYVIALPLAAFIAGVTMEATFLILNRQWFSIKLFDKSVLPTLLKMAVPMLPNFLIYWIFNSSDKIMITNILSIGDAGIYSVGSKLGHASQLIYTAFAGGWQFFAFSTMKEKNQVESNSRIYEGLGVISFAATAFVCAISFIFYKYVFAQQYISGFIIAPYLFMAPLLQMLYQTGNSQFLVIKKTWPGMFILSSGAIVNIFLNLLLIPKMGIEGAALATLLGYFTAATVDIIVLSKLKLMKVRKNFFIVAGCMALYFAVWRIFFSKSLVFSLILCAAFYAVICFMYKDDISFMVKKLKDRRSK